MRKMKALVTLLVAFVFLTVIVCTKDPAGTGIDPLNNDGAMIDQEGNVYQTVRIGNQVWMAENLRVTKYNDGSAVQFDTSTATWNSATTPKYCYYNNTTNSDSIKKYGALYNWYVVSPANPKKIAPAGWHIPTDAEWTILEKYLVLNGYNWDSITTGNTIAKTLASQTDWSTSEETGTIGCDLTKNNRSGFSALGGGCRSGDGTFYGQTYYGHWWSATEGVAASSAYGRSLLSIDFSLGRGFSFKSCGFSVRVVRD